MKAEEILKVITENMGVHQFAYQDYSPEDLGLGKVTVPDQYGGEDKGSTWYIVQYFVEHDVYIRTDGWYSSYDGVYFDEGYGSEVKPIQRQVTFYE
jgi:hypothetical protein